MGGHPGRLAGSRRPRPRTPRGAGRPARSGPRRGSPTLPPAGRRTRRPGHGIGAARRPGSSGRGRRAGADGGSRTGRARRAASSTKLSTSSWSGSSRAPGGRSMIPARTSGLNERPMIAPAPAAAWASGERCAIRARTASSMVSGTVASRIARPIRSGVRAQGAQKLLDVEGDAVRPLVDGVRDLTWRRQAGIEDQRRHERGLGCGQRAEPQLLGHPLGDQAGAPGAQAAARRHVLRPVIAGQQRAGDPVSGGPARR